MVRREDDGFGDMEGETLQKSPAKGSWALVKELKTDSVTNTVSEHMERLNDIEDAANAVIRGKDSGNQDTAAKEQKLKASKAAQASYEQKMLTRAQQRQGSVLQQRHARNETVPRMHQVLTLDTFFTSDERPARLAD